MEREVKLVATTPVVQGMRESTASGHALCSLSLPSVSVSLSRRVSGDPAHLHCHPGELVQHAVLAIHRSVSYDRQMM